MLDKKHMDEMRIMLEKMIGGENPAPFKNLAVEITRATAPNQATYDTGYLAMILLHQYMTYDVMNKVLEELKLMNSKEEVKPAAKPVEKPAK